MSYIVKNIIDRRIVAKHKNYDRYYVRGGVDDIPEGLELFITDDLEKANNILKSTQHTWAGINVEGWRVANREKDKNE